MPQGSPAPLGGGQSVPPSLLRANSGLLGGQGHSQNGYQSLVSPRNQFNNMNMIGNSPNVSSLLHQSFGNGGSRSGQRGLIDGGAESDPLSGVGNGMGFSQPSPSYMSSPMASNPNSSGQGQQFTNNASSQMLTGQQVDPQNFQLNSQQQFSVPSNSQQQPQQQQQFQGMRGGLGGVGPLKMEPQVTNEQAQALRNLGPVKLEPQQLQNTRGLGPVKMEPSDSSLFLHQQQQQQQQQHLLMSRPSHQAAAAAQMYHQQRIMHMQQQQQLLKSMPPQRSGQFQNQNLPIRSPVKPVYEPGMCARRLTHYMYQQQHRPEVRKCRRITFYLSTKKDIIQCAV